MKDFAAVYSFLLMISVWAGCGADGGHSPLVAEDLDRAGADATAVQGIALADSNLAASVRAALGIENGIVTEEQALSLTQLNASGQGIADLTGIEQFKNLRILDLANNQLRDIAPVAELTDLVFLNLDGNQVSDLSPLEFLAKLEVLLLVGNAVQDIAALTGLQALDLVDLTSNPLDEGATGAQIPALAVRDIEVRFEAAGSVDDDAELLVAPAEFKIAFTSDRGGSAELYVMDDDGSDVRQLTEGLDTFFFNVSWSFDGRKLVFNSRQGAIYTVSADGSGLQNLSEPDVFEGSPVWTPDGTRIVFGSRADDVYGLYSMNADGSDRVLLVDLDIGLEDGKRASNHNSPSWSSDGTRLVFALGFVEPGVNIIDEEEIYIFDTTASALQNVSNQFGVDTRPVWSPDGRALLFIGNNGGSRFNLYKAEIADGTFNASVLLTDVGVVQPSWSADGGGILYVAAEGRNSDVFLADEFGGNAVNLTDDPALDHYPSWSPDGGRIVFYSDRDGDSDIYVMGADGSRTVNLTDNEASDVLPFWSPR